MENFLEPTAETQFHRHVKQGMGYYQLIRALADKIGCERYFEIGVFTGNSLAMVNARSVGVDPKFKFTADVVGTKECLMLFQVKSDEFFAKYDLTALLGGPFDLAFLDGMHLFEFLLRDFMNTERHARPDSIILLHDCFPVNCEMAGRSNAAPRQDQDYAKHWTGDVWKTLVILKALRPDLKITALNSPPTGIVAVSNLDPASTVLKSNYEAIVAEYMDVELTERRLDELHATFELLAPKPYIARLNTALPPGR